MTATCQFTITPELPPRWWKYIMPRRERTQSILGPDAALSEPMEVRYFYGTDLQFELLLSEMDEQHERGTRFREDEPYYDAHHRSLSSMRRFRR